MCREVERCRIVTECRQTERTRGTGGGSPGPGHAPPSRLTAGRPRAPHVTPARTHAHTTLTYFTYSHSLPYQYAHNIIVLHIFIITNNNNTLNIGKTTLLFIIIRKILDYTKKNLHLNALNNII